VRDQRSALPGTPNIKGDGYSIWVIPRDKRGWEGLLRYDHHTPNTSSDFAPLATAGNLTTTLKGVETRLRALEDKRPAAPDPVTPKAARKKRPK